MSQHSPRISSPDRLASLQLSFTESGLEFTPVTSANLFGLAGSTASRLASPAILPAASHTGGLSPNRNPIREQRVATFMPRELASPQRHALPHSIPHLVFHDSVP